jgi:hypothetical protein
VRVRPTLLLSCERKPRGGIGTDHDHVAQAELLKLQKSGQFPDERLRVTMEGELGNRGGQSLKIWYEKLSTSSYGIVHLQVIGGRFATDTSTFK